MERKTAKGVKRRVEDAHLHFEYYLDALKKLSDISLSREPYQVYPAYCAHSSHVQGGLISYRTRALRLVYKNENSTFDELLDLDNFVTVHQINLQKLAMEMYRAKKHISPTPMQEIFTEQIIPYDLRNERCWQVPNARIVYNGLESIRYRGPKIWASLPTTIKESKSLAEFKTKTKTWKDSNCTCRLCKTYIANLGFIG